MRIPYQSGGIGLFSGGVGPPLTPSKSAYEVSSLYASDNSEPKIIFEFFFLIFCQFFGVILKLAHYSVQTILSQKYFFRLFFLDFLVYSYLKVGSFIVSDNSEPKIFFAFFFLKK